MSSDKEEFEKELRANKIEVIRLLAEQMVQLKHNEYKEYQIAEDKPIAYLDATIDILKKTIKNAEENKAELIKFDKLEAERANLTPEQFEELKAAQERNNKIVDSYLATLEPRASLKGRVQAPNSIILRYRGKGINDEFSKKYPVGVLL